jgi:hypothetical protein
MGHRTSLALALALALTACGRPAAAPEAAAPDQAGATAAPGAEPAAAPVPGAGSAGLPANGFDDVPGWLAFTVQPADQRARGWTPAHPNASVAIVGADAWSETVEEGTRFRLVSREGNLPLTLSEVSRIPYGCDGNQATMAAFRTPHDLTEQLVWILPEGPQGNEAAAVVPVTAGAKSKRQRSWTVGALAIRAQLDGAHKGRLEVRRGEQALLVHPFEKTEMQGADMAALDLTRDFEIGVPYPEAALRLSDALTIVVLRTVSYEGVSFEVLALRDTLARAGSQYVYLCAF